MEWLKQNRRSETQRNKWLIIYLCFLCTIYHNYGSAITWDFDDDSQQGWVARESIGAGIFTSRISGLHQTVENAIWRITPLPYSAFIENPNRRITIQLVSPIIGYDSELFDTLRIRLRTVHSKPIQGSVHMSWTNPTNRDRPGSPPFQLAGTHRFNTASSSCFLQPSFQEIVLTNFTQEIPERPEAHWQGELIDVRINIALGPFGPHGVEPPRNREDIPDLIEVDRIILTGIGEQFLHEPLAVPGTDQKAPQPGTLFAPAEFYPLITGIGPVYAGSFHSAVLLDANENGLLDLVALWSRTGLDNETDLQGWVLALNDGGGGFRTRKEYTVTMGLELFAVDLTGDGVKELILFRGGQTEVWRITEELEMQTVLELPGRYPLNVTGDDDNAALFVLDYNAPNGVEIWTYTDGSFASIAVFWESPLRPSSITSFLRERTWIWWRRALGGDKSQWLATDTYGEPLQTEIELEFSPELLCYAGDLNQNGDIEFVSGNRRIWDVVDLLEGLTVWQLQSTGEMVAQPWYDEQIRLRHLWAWDLNGNGLVDPVFIKENAGLINTVVVNLGRRDGLPVEEGRYPLTGRGGQILAGDVTNDGNPDLVVVDPALGGVHVLRNRLAEEPVTAVHEPAAVRPTGVHLGPNYPNPFNPHTSIPFTLAAADAVRLQVYDLRGRLVRTLWDGPLAAGAHRLDWDGRNTAGQPVASGVYLYRLEVGGQVHSRKLLKLQ